MDHTNHWYGHAHILAEYCGFDPADPPPIRGVIQHGWTFVHGLGYGHINDRSFTKLVWNDRCRRRGQVIGWRDFAVIGAPFNYLVDLKKEEAPQVEPKGTIFYPFHGTVDYETVAGRHDELIEHVRSVETGPVTACLYYVEYDDPEIRKHYEDAGFRVITHGRRGNQWKGTDRLFLHRQLAELKRHRRIISNRLTTAVFYGASVGLDAGVYGDPMQFVGGKSGFDGTHLLDALYPEMVGEHLDMDAVRETTRLELGTDYLLSPDELRYTLGWDEPWLESSN